MTMTMTISSISHSESDISVIFLQLWLFLKLFCVCHFWKTVFVPGVLIDLEKEKAIVWEDRQHFMNI